MKKRILSLLVALCLVVSMVPAAFAAGAEQYNDIPAGSWYTQYVDAVTSAGYFEGYGNGRFAPTDKMTRAMFVTVMSRMDGATVDNTVSQFPDVPANMWYTGAVTWAQTNNIVKGRNETTFAPNDPITRAEMSIIMNRFVNYYAAKTNKVPETTSREINFSDIADLNEEYTSSIKSCVSYGLIEGYPDGTFKPSASATRAEVAAVVSRLAWKTTGFPGGTGGTTPTTPPSYTQHTVTYKFGDVVLATPKTTTTGAFTVLTWDEAVKDHSDVKAPENKELSVWKGDDGKEYKPGESATTSSDLVLTPKFDFTKYTVTYKVGEETLKTDTTTAEEPYTVLTWEAVKGTHELEQGKAFASWVDGENAYSEDSQITVTGNLTLTAHFVDTRDLLFFAMKNAIDEANHWYDETHGKVEGVDGLGTYGDAMFDHFGLNDKTSGTDGDTREQAVSGTVTINGETIGDKVIDVAAETALGIIGGTGDDTVAGLQDSITQLVDDIAKALGITLDETSLRAKATSIYQWFVKEGHDKVLAKAEFHKAATAVKVTVGGKSVELTFNSNGGVTLKNGTSKKQAARTLGVALAEQLYASVQKVNEYTSKVPATAKIGLVFTPTSEQQKQNYPTKYPFTVTLNVTDPQEVLSYKFADDTNFVKVTLTSELQAKYGTEIEAVIDALMTGDNLEGQVTDMKDAMLANDGAFGEIVSALTSFYGTTTEEEQKGRVEHDVNQWLADNLNTDTTSEGNENLEHNVLYQHYWVKEGKGDIIDLFDNTAISGITSANDGLIGYLGDGAAKYFNDQLAAIRDKFESEAVKTAFDSFIKEIFEQSSPDKFDEVLRDIAEFDPDHLNKPNADGSSDSSISFDMVNDLEPGIKNYIYACIFDDQLNTPSHNTYREQYYNAMADAVDDLIEKEINGKLEEGGLGSLVETLPKLRTVSDLADVTLSELKALLTNDLVSGGSTGTENPFDGYKDQLGGYVKRVANAAANRNGEVTVTLKLGNDTTVVTLKEDALKEIASQTTGSAALSTFMNKVENLKLGNLKLSDMHEDGWLKVTVKVGTREVTVAPVVVINGYNY